MSEPTTPADPSVPESAAGETAATPGFGAHPVVIYTLKRLLLLLVVGGLMYVVGLRGVWLILLAFLVSGAIAMVVLKSSREGAAYGITHAVKKVNDRIDESSRAEDEDDLDDDLADLDASDDDAEHPDGARP